MHEENKNNNFIQQCLLFCVSLRRAFMTVPRRTQVHFSACKQVSWYSCQRASKTNTEEKTLMNKIFIFVFFTHTEKRSFITLRLNTDATWTILTMSLLPFWVLNVSVVLQSMQGKKALGFYQKYLNLCSKDERGSYGFGMTWGWVINHNFHFWVNYHFKAILELFCYIPLHIFSLDSKLGL